jgi:hypothetical protein
MTAGDKPPNPPTPRRRHNPEEGGWLSPLHFAGLAHPSTDAYETPNQCVRHLPLTRDESPDM